MGDTTGVEAISPNAGNHTAATVPNTTEDEAMIVSGYPPRITFNGKSYETPSISDLEAWVFDSVCETPEGTIVEPDHPDSWFSILGLI